MLQQTLLLFQEAEDLDREMGTQSLFDIIAKSGTMGIIIVLALFVGPLSLFTFL